MPQKLIVMASVLAAVAALACMAQNKGFDSAHPTVTSPFPQVWDCPPQHYDCVLAVRISPIERSDYMKVMSFVCLKWSADAIPAHMDGFSAGYADDPNGGAGYVRMEFQCNSKSDVNYYIRTFKNLLHEKLRQRTSPVFLELVMVLSPRMQEKLHLPSPEYERYGPIKVD
jgi:hypothetical protein